MCLQETKISQMDNVLLKETCGNNLRQARMLNANGTRGGILIAWLDRRFQQIDCHTGSFTVTVMLTNREDGQRFYITGVYGPCDNVLRQKFLDELRDIKPINGIPWVVCGDFNFTLELADNTPHGSNHQPTRFAQVISSMGLINLPLQNRKHKWSRANGQLQPAMARLDRFLISTEWNTIYPTSAQQALPNTSSDHCPILYTVTTKSMKTNFFRFENSWLRSTQLRQMVTEKWQQGQKATTPNELHVKFAALTKEIQIWAKDRMSTTKRQIATCREYIGWVDTINEIRLLTALEKVVISLIKERYTHLYYN